MSANEFVGLLLNVAVIPGAQSFRDRRAPEDAPRVFCSLSARRTTLFFPVDDLRALLAFEGPHHADLVVWSKARGLKDPDDSEGAFAVPSIKPELLVVEIKRSDGQHGVEQVIGTLLELKRRIGAEASRFRWRAVFVAGRATKNGETERDWQELCLRKTGVQLHVGHADPYDLLPELRQAKPVAGAP